LHHLLSEPKRLDHLQHYRLESHLFYEYDYHE
jgi:hypothetical protein